MLSFNGDHILCDGSSECPNRVKNHRWGRTKAEDWFFMKGGKAFCPDHIPDWVQEWQWREK